MRCMLAHRYGEIDRRGPFCSAKYGITFDILNIGKIVHIVLLLINIRM